MDPNIIKVPPMKKVSFFGPVPLKYAEPEPSNSMGTAQSSVSASNFTSINPQRNYEASPSRRTLTSRITHPRSMLREHNPLSQRLGAHKVMSSGRIQRTNVKHKKVLSSGRQIKTLLKCVHLNEGPVWGAGTAAVKSEEINTVDADELRRMRINNKIDKLCLEAALNKATEDNNREFEQLLKIPKHTKVLSDGHQVKTRMRCDHASREPSRVLRSTSRLQSSYSNIDNQENIGMLSSLPTNVGRQRRSIKSNVVFGSNRNEKDIFCNLKEANIDVPIIDINTSYLDEMSPHFCKDSHGSDEELSRLKNPRTRRPHHSHSCRYCNRDEVFPDHYTDCAESDDSIKCSRLYHGHSPLEDDCTRCRRFSLHPRYNGNSCMRPSSCEKYCTFHNEREYLDTLKLRDCCHCCSNYKKYCKVQSTCHKSNYSEGYKSQEKNRPCSGTNRLPDARVRFAGFTESPEHSSHDDDIQNCRAAHDDTDSNVPRTSACARQSRSNGKLPTKSPLMTVSSSPPSESDGPERYHHHTVRQGRTSNRDPYVVPNGTHGDHSNSRLPTRETGAIPKTTIRSSKLQEIFLSNNSRNNLVNKSPRFKPASLTAKPLRPAMKSVAVSKVKRSSKQSLALEDHL